MKQVQENSFISYVLSDQVWWCNIKLFLSCTKITSANLCKPIYDINYSTSICPFVSKKCGKEGKKLQKFKYLELFRWNKKHFSVFEGLPFGEKIKIWQKIADTSFKTFVPNWQGLDSSRRVSWPKLKDWLAFGKIWVIDMLEVKDMIEEECP